MAKNVQNSHFSFARIFILAESTQSRSSPLHEAAERQAVRKPFFLLKFSHFAITTTQITPFKKSAFLGCKFNWVENKV
jgi:hypothetical protein